ncbi:GH3 auxin-responsive promoter family protein [Planctomicrobium piriforme]|uniref:GH3 auxin-responsive promoter n=1 Tax=Planctomicrobium piriforme TaxID=1576369 RepID=A0A1I3RJD9_9PLAN|nr:GH3 auxin-responsive promoter family protein [Planctomicrobium piriforme]SFJ46388.1 GH3 auxin-responsive promoter [Planctomicrobium piriforme]
MIHTIRNALGHAVRRKLRRQLEQTLYKAGDCRRVQAETLLRLLALNAGSCFQRDYRLDSVRSIADFQRTLPVADYARPAPYIERVKQGETAALLGRRNRLLMFALTSGTTNASKFIPITRPFIQAYRQGWQLWGARAFDDHPRLHGRTVMQLSSGWDKFRTVANIPCGNISGLVQRMQNPIVRSLYTVPGVAGEITQADQKFYFALKRSLCARNLALMTTANPSTLCQLFRVLHEQGERLIRDLFDGTDPYDGISRLPRHLRSIRNVPRARELDQLLQSTGALHPRSVWKELELAAVWTGGSAAAYLPRLREYLGDLAIRDHGLHASEGRMTIPLEDENPSGLLDIGTHFFEFIPEDEIDSPDPTVLQAHELVEDESYFILLTTASGLYRYDIRDVVQCTGFYGTTPMLRFLHKGSHISSLTGEKLTESQVVNAVTKVASKADVRLDCFTLTPQWGDPPHYVLLAEETCWPTGVSSTEFAFRVDEELRQVNDEYLDKRDSGRLGPCEAIQVPTAQWQAFIAQRQSTAGGSTEQYKHPYLAPSLETLKQFQLTPQACAAPTAERPSPSAH